VEKPYLGLIAGVAAAVVVSPFAALPLIGTSTALLFGAVLGPALSMGAKEAREGVSFDDD
jgi:hypothetical protein